MASYEGGYFTAGIISLSLSLVIIFCFILYIIMAITRKIKIKKIKKEITEGNEEKLLLKKNRKGIKYFNPIFFTESFVYPYLLIALFFSIIPLLILIPLLFFLLFFFFAHIWLIGFDDEKKELVLAKKDALFGLWVTEKERIPYEKVGYIDFVKQSNNYSEAIYINLKDGKELKCSSYNNMHERSHYGVDMINAILQKRREGNLSKV